MSYLNPIKHLIMKKIQHQQLIINNLQLLSLNILL